MIDIIIPCYNAHNTLDKTLQSICVQSIKDKCKVLLVDDYSNKDYSDFIEKYKKYIDISVLRLDKNMGSGTARREGINHTKSKYIVFIDSDDMFYSVDALNDLYNEIENGYDVVNSVEYDEKRNILAMLNGNVHGKIYRRKYLKDNNITFNDTRVHEDNYFNNYCLLSGAKCFDIYSVTYYYVYNKKSITNIKNIEFERLEMYLSNMFDLMNIANNNNYDKVKILFFKKEKYLYLSRLYKSLNRKKKKEFIKLIEKYDPNYLKYLDKTDEEKKSLLLTEYFND